ncbi:MAG: YbaK/EbsC family protein [Candidatus Aenigmatarchaeota archaeon]|nr:YbaK/EbsC family protein [Candidatus Aenigmarchaeota archaeon]
MNEKILKAIEKLKQKGVYYRVLDIGKPARTAEEVAMFYDVNPREIIKTLMIKAGEQIYAVMLPGVLKIDNKKLSKVLGKSDIRFLNSDELFSIGFFQGEVCPILIEKEILVDKKVFETEKINFGSGDVYFGIEINSKDLMSLIKGKIVDISKD